MLFERQKLLLALLDAIGGEVGNLDFQKLLFLFCQETGEAPPYEFVPFRFGGFSFTSYADRRKLTAKRLLSDDDSRWVLTEQGRKAARVSPGYRARIDCFARTYARLRGNSLIAETYRRFPYYASRSEIAERILNRKPKALAAIDASRPDKGKPGICTIGYEGVSLERYLNRLLRAGVSLLCDVRRNPLSRKFGFSKGTLSKSCESLGVEYKHLPELGIASVDRKDLRNQEDYDALFALYRRRSLPGQLPALEKIRDWVFEGHRVALTCYEHLPEQCHRHCVAEELETAFGKAFAPSNL